MKVTIKSAEEIEKMRFAGEILAAVHQNLAREIKPGMSTLDIDRLGEEMIRGYADKIPLPEKHMISWFTNQTGTTKTAANTTHVPTSFAIIPQFFSLFHPVSAILQKMP